MTTIAQSFLTDTDREQIVAAVQRAERITSGEIVPLVAGSSADYHAAEFNGALALGLSLSIVAAWLLEKQDMWTFLLIFCAAYAASFLAVRLLPGLKRLFIPNAVKNDEVTKAAMTAFHTHGLHRTRDLTGVLIYVSVFERRVHVLADKGINDKVDPSTWDEVVNIVTSGIRSGMQGAALAEAVTRCGELLASHFPVRSDDCDELPNLIVEGDDI